MLRCNRNCFHITGSWVRMKNGLLTSTFHRQIKYRRVGMERTHPSKANYILDAQVREDIVDVDVPGDAKNETRRISSETHKQKFGKMICEGH